MKNFIWSFFPISVMLTILSTACGATEKLIVPTSSPVPTNTNMVLSTPVPTGLPSPTMTLPATFPPPLSEAVQLKFNNLLKNNGGCEFPCFLGITPGKTSWQAANLILEEYAFNKHLNPNPSSTMHIQIATDYDISFYGYIQVEVAKSGFVRHITFQVQTSHQGKTETHDKHLSYYSIKEMFKKYGHPDAVYLYTTNQNLVYSMEVVYEKLKMVVEYTGLAKQNAIGGYRICPNLGDGDIDLMKIAFANPEDPLDAKTLLGNLFYESSLPIEKATEMSLKDFYHLMIGDNQPACFQLK